MSYPYAVAGEQSDAQCGSGQAAAEWVAIHGAEGHKAGKIRQRQKFSRSRHTTWKLGDNICFPLKINFSPPGSKVP